MMDDEVGYLLAQVFGFLALVLLVLAVLMVLFGA